MPGPEKSFDVTGNTMCLLSGVHVGKFEMAPFMNVSRVIRFVAHSYTERLVPDPSIIRTATRLPSGDQRGFKYTLGAARRTCIFPEASKKASDRSAVLFDPAI